MENEPAGVTFTSCVRQCRPYAEQLRSQAFHKILMDWSPTTPTKRGRSGSADESPERESPRGPKRGKRGGKKEQRKGDSAKEKRREVIRRRQKEALR